MKENEFLIYDVSSKAEDISIGGDFPIHDLKGIKGIIRVADYE
jgi:hypothetical protein